LQDGYTFSPSGKYRVPEHSTTEQVLAYIDQLPENDAPEIFGMHNNANVTYLRAKSALLIETILSVQPRQQTGSSGKSSDN